MHKHEYMPLLMAATNMWAMWSINDSLLAALSTFCRLLSAQSTMVH
jgi:hypothetical protein